METPSTRYIITRALFLLGAIIATLYATKFVKKKQRQSAIVVELQALTSDSSFFKQFYAEEAKKSLVRAVGLLVEANQLGVSPVAAIDRGLGIKQQSFASDLAPPEPSPREKIIRTCLLGNYANFLKLGFKPDFQTLAAMKAGDLPAIPNGQDAGKKPEIGSLIAASISPGIEKVIANLEIRPPLAQERPPTDIEIAAAKVLTNDLADAMIIEEPVRDRILQELSKPNVKP